MGNTPSAVPYGAQITKINTTLACSALGSYGDYGFALSATAPLIANAQQDIYYSDIVVDIDLNGVFQSSFGMDAPGNYSISANIGIDLRYAQSQKTINLTAVTTADDRQSHVRFPAAGGVLPALGPVKMGNAGNIHSFSLGKVDFNVSLGSLTIPVSCAKQTPQVIIGSTVIARGSGGAALAPSNGAPGQFPLIRPGEKATIAKYPVVCDADADPNRAFLRRTPFNITLGGVVPNVLKAGQTFNVSGINTFFTVPQAIVVGYGSYLAGDPKTYSIQLNGNPGFGLQLLGTTPYVDLAKNFTSAYGEPRPLSGSAQVSGDPSIDLPIALPGANSISLGPFTTSGNVGTNFQRASGVFAVSSPGPGPYRFESNFTCNSTYSSQIWT